MKVYMDEYVKKQNIDIDIILPKVNLLRLYGKRELVADIFVLLYDFSISKRILEKYNRKLPILENGVLESYLPDLFMLCDQGQAS